MSRDYEGDVSVAQCWATLAEDPKAVLVDVRTIAEWTYVGLPALDAIGKRVVLSEWQSFPSMAVDGAFAQKTASLIAEAGGDPEAPVFFLCRSGARSMASAAALTAEGYRHCFNILDGFEGPADAEGHRGTTAGWKAEGLPWAQR